MALVAGLLASLFAVASPAAAQDTGGGAVEVRIAARKVADGRVEFALQQRQDASWGQRLLPRSRMFPTAAAVGRWLTSTPLTLTMTPTTTAPTPVNRPTPHDSPYQRILYRYSNIDSDRNTLGTVNVDRGNHQQGITYEGSDYPLFSPDGSRFAYSDWRNNEIWVADADGSNAVKVGDDSIIGFDELDVWSPDGARLVTSNDSPGLATGELRIVNADGTNSRKVTDSWAQPGGTTEPGWAPDGSRYAYFERTRSAPFIYSLGVVNADGTNPRRVADGIATFNSGWTYWSPNSDRLAYLVGTGEGDELWMANADGSNAREVVPSPVWDHIWWSPDGARFAFRTSCPWFRTLPCPESGLRVANADGTNVRRLDGFPISWDEQMWSPDGATLLYMSGGRLMMIDADGTNPRVICNCPPSSTGHSKWSPDGTRLIHLSQHGLWIANSDGSNPRRLISTEGNDVRRVELSPDGSRLLYLDATEIHKRDGCCRSRGELWVISVDGTARRKVADEAFWPKWSPDGANLSYTVERIENRGRENQQTYRDPWIADGDGSNPRRIVAATSAARPSFGIWSPDSAHLVYTIETDTAEELWIARGDGTNPRRILTIPFKDPEESSVIVVAAWLK